LNLRKKSAAGVRTGNNGCGAGSGASAYSRLCDGELFIPSDLGGGGHISPLTNYCARKGIAELLQQRQPFGIGLGGVVILMFIPLVLSTLL